MKTMKNRSLVCVPALEFPKVKVTKYAPRVVRTFKPAGDTDTSEMTFQGRGVVGSSCDRE